MSSPEEKTLTITPEDIHMPSPSYWPIILAFGIFCILGGLAMSIALSITGIIISLVAVIGWVIEPPFADEH